MILGYFGDGHLILTNNKKLFSKFHKIQMHGINEKTKNIDLWGYNSMSITYQKIIKFSRK